MDWVWGDYDQPHRKCKDGGEVEEVKLAQAAAGFLGRQLEQ